MAVIRAGETLSIEITVDAVSLTAQAVGPQNHALTASQSSNLWKIQADTTGWTAGRYLVGAMATLSDGTKSRVPEAFVDVLPALSSITAGTDLSTQAETIVKNIELMLAGNAGAGVKRYKINNRELERYGVDELLKLLNYWKGQVLKESRKRRGESILGPQIQVRI